MFIYCTNQFYTTKTVFYHHLIFFIILKQKIIIRFVLNSYSVGIIISI